MVKQAIDPIDFFIIHASGDTSAAVAIRDGLKTLGRSCFMPADDLLPGEAGDEIIPRALHMARLVLILVSSSGATQHEQAEQICRAVDGHREGRQRVVPVLLDESPAIPYGLRRLTPLVVTGGDLSMAAQSLAGLLRPDDIDRSARYGCWGRWRPLSPMGGPLVLPETLARVWRSAGVRVPPQHQRQIAHLLAQPTGVSIDALADITDADVIDALCGAGLIMSEANRVRARWPPVDVELTLFDPHRWHDDLLRPSSCLRLATHTWLDVELRERVVTHDPAGSRYVDGQAETLVAGASHHIDLAPDDAPAAYEQIMLHIRPAPRELGLRRFDDVGTLPAVRPSSAALAHERSRFCAFAGPGWIFEAVLYRPGPGAPNVS